MGVAPFSKERPHVSKQLTIRTFSHNDSNMGLVFCGPRGEIIGSSLHTRGGLKGDTVPASWFRWVAGADKVIAVWERDMGGRTMRDMQYIANCFARYTGLQVNSRTKLRPWFRRKVRGRWEAYWYAPW